jgi:hypothetical protein
VRGFLFVIASLHVMELSFLLENGNTVYRVPKTISCNALEDYKGSRKENLCFVCHAFSSRHDSTVLFFFALLELSRSCHSFVLPHK